MRPSRPDAWTTVADLAEYAYCPRAWWYRAHPPPGGPDPSGRRRAAAGQWAHERRLRATRDRDRHAARYWVALAAATAVLALAAGVALWLSA